MELACGVTAQVVWLKVDGWGGGGGGDDTIFFLDVLYFMISSKCLSVNQNITLMVFCLLYA